MTHTYLHQITTAYAAAADPEGFRTKEELTAALGRAYDAQTWPQGYHLNHLVQYGLSQHWVIRQGGRYHIRPHLTQAAA